MASSAHCQKPCSCNHPHDSWKKCGKIHAAHCDVAYSLELCRGVVDCAEKFSVVNTTFPLPCELAKNVLATSHKVNKGAQAAGW